MGGVFLKSDKRTGRRPKFERDLFQMFFDAKIAEGVSKRTLETYRENFRFLANVTTELLRSYQTWMLATKLRFEGHEHKSERVKTAGLSPVTVNTRTKTLSCMFRFWKAEGLIDSDPWESVKKVEEAHTEIQVMTVDQLRKLLQAPNQRSYAGFRDHVLMSVLIDGFSE